MILFLRKRWFLIALTFLISVGMGLGLRAPEQATQATAWINPMVTTAIVLVLMAFTLDSGMLAASFRSPGPVVLGCLMNAVFVPVFTLLLSPLQIGNEFRYGIVIAGSVPCTLAAASVWTRKARGNDAVSLLVTLVTNGGSFLVAPFWLMIIDRWVASQSGAEGAFASIDGGIIDAPKMMYKLFLAVLLPTLAGQLLRQIKVLAGIATRFKEPIGVIAQSLILLLVFVNAVGGGTSIQTSGAPGAISGVAVVWISCIVVHVVALYVALTLARRLRFSRADQAAVAFAGSQKTLPVGILIANEVARNSGLSFAIFPILMYHISQLFIDTAIADSLAAAAHRAAAAEREESSPAPEAPL